MNEDNFIFYWKKEEMIFMRMPTHCGNESCSSFMVADDFNYLAHHTGGFEE